MHASHSFTSRAILALSIVGMSALAACSQSNHLPSAHKLPAASQPAEFTDEDRQVIEAVLLSLINDPQFRVYGAESGHCNSIALINETQRATHRLEEEYEHCPMPGGLSPDAIRAFAERNKQPAPIDATGWGAQIRVIKEVDIPRNQYVYSPDEREYCLQNPGTRGVVRACLPCYLGDATSAYLELGYRWSAAHSASAEFLLRKTNGKWTVIQRTFKLYA